MINGISIEDAEALRTAKSLLEGESFAMNLAAKVGMPLEALMRFLPEKAQENLGIAVNKALERCLQVALLAHGNDTRLSVVTPRGKRLHSLTTAVTGAAGGFFGLPGLAVELPITTTVMLHSITSIARHHGEDLTRPEPALACLQVLALGAQGTRNEAIDSAYYASRAALAQVTRDAAAYVAEKGMAKEGAPVLVAFLSRIAARFGLEVTEKAAAQLIPIAGAAGGAALNVMFTNHFQRLAEGHFTIRALDRKYGPELIRSEYDRIEIPA
jgi:NAD(P)-dependent dehydrogenase (short-subunit alcohol dehydrogenase family)